MLGESAAGQIDDEFVDKLLDLARVTLGVSMSFVNFIGEEDTAANWHVVLPEKEGEDGAALPAWGSEAMPFCVAGAGFHRSQTTCQYTVAADDGKFAFDLETGFDLEVNINGESFDLNRLGAAFMAPSEQVSSFVGEPSKGMGAIYTQIIPRLKYYAGRTIKIDGHAVGSFCVMDQQNRTDDFGNNKVPASSGADGVPLPPPTEGGAPAHTLEAFADILSCYLTKKRRAQGQLSFLGQQAAVALKMQGALASLSALSLLPQPALPTPAAAALAITAPASSSPNPSIGGAAVEEKQAACPAPAAAAEGATDAEAETEAEAAITRLSASGGLLFFDSPTCGVCAEQRPALDTALATATQPLPPVEHIIATAAPGVTRAFGVRGFPTFLILAPGGVELERREGKLDAAALASLLDAAASAGGN